MTGQTTRNTPNVKIRKRKNKYGETGKVDPQGARSKTLSHTKCGQIVMGDQTLRQVVFPYHLEARDGVQLVGLHVWDLTHMGDLMGREG